MFTLRDQIFPGEAGTAGAISSPAYRLSVGQICDDVNTAERARVRELRPLDRRVRRSRTTLQQRNALLDAVRRELDRSSHAAAALMALDPPKALSAGQRSTAAAWNRNLNRIKAYAQRLDHAFDRRGVMASISELSRQRSVIAGDGLRVTSGLERLGEAHCRIAAPRPTPTLTLPPVEDRVPSVKPNASPSTPQAGGVGARAPSLAAPDARGGSGASGGSGAAGGGADQPGVNRPSPITPSVNTPSAGLPRRGLRPLLSPRFNTPSAAMPQATVRG